MSSKISKKASKNKNNEVNSKIIKKERIGQVKILTYSNGLKKELICGDSYSDEFGSTPCVCCGHGDCTCGEDKE